MGAVDWLRTLWLEGIMFGELKAAVCFLRLSMKPNFIHSKIKSNGNKNKEAG